MGAINETKEVYWRKQVALARKCEGSLEAFCRERGLSPASLAYWRKKLRAADNKALTVSPFVPATIIPSASGSTLPDPRWVAELIVELVRRQG